MPLHASRNHQRGSPISAPNRRDHREPWFPTMSQGMSTQLCVAFQTLCQLRRTLPSRPLSIPQARCLLLLESKGPQLQADPAELHCAHSLAWTSAVAREQALFLKERRIGRQTHAATLGVHCLARQRWIRQLLNMSPGCCTSPTRCSKSHATALRHALDSDGDAGLQCPVGVSRGCDPCCLPTSLNSRFHPGNHASFCFPGGAGGLLGSRTLHLLAGDTVGQMWTVPAVAAHHQRDSAAKGPNQPLYHSTTTVELGRSG